ncbi:YceD family protein [Croceimicrobium sp.]|uniref:YceD family protein n=1 Tax=Croceimicrobium sp. TaxID=2828340 RepID=UPI003BAC3D21
MEKRLKDFEIAFSGLKLGEHQFDFQIDATFFEAFDYQDFEKADLQAKMKLLKRETQMALHLELEGKVWVPCDLTNEMFWLPLSAEAEVMVKFGDDFDDSEEDLLILPHGEHRFNVAQYFYEMAVLAKPLKVVHPDVEAGKMGQEILERLEALSPEEHSNEEQSEEVDPRWDKLKDLLN